MRILAMPFFLWIKHNWGRAQFSGVMERNSKQISDMETVWETCCNFIVTSEYQLSHFLRENTHAHLLILGLSSLWFLFQNKSWGKMSAQHCMQYRSKLGALPVGWLSLRRWFRTRFRAWIASMWKGEQHQLVAWYLSRFFSSLFVISRVDTC